MRDWSRGQALGYYSIHPSQFDTRMPLHINDDDLCPESLKTDAYGHVTERPRSEFTMLSYTVYALEISIFVREAIDVRGPLGQTQRQGETNEGAKMRNYLNKKYENLVARLPSYFTLASTAGLNSEGLLAAIPVQRWMLHQQLWSLFLRAHRGSLSSKEGRASCLLLAQNIIVTQAQIQARCTVCGSLSANDTQLFNAAVVLLIDILFSATYRDGDCSIARLSRLMARQKIAEAIELLRMRSGAGESPLPSSRQLRRAKASSQRSVAALEALMKLEEEESSYSEGNNMATSAEARTLEQEAKSNNSAPKSLKTKVMDILDALQGSAQRVAAATEQANLSSFSSADKSASFPTGTNGFQDLNALPLLSDDTGFNFWQLLDFTTPQPFHTQSGAFAATTDYQTPIDPTSFRQHSGVADPLSSFDGSKHADMFQF